MIKKLLLALFALTSIINAQTSVSCTSGTYCGNSQVHSSNNGGQVNKWGGIPFTVNTGYTISNTQWYLDTAVVSNLSMMLVCDSNLSGATIGNAAPCPSNNVICNTGTQTETAVTPTGTTTYTLSGCGTLLTTVRYWILYNFNSGSALAGITTTGSPVTAFQKFGTCCTVPASFTGAMASLAQNTSYGVTLVSGGGVVCVPQLTLLGVGGC